MTDRGYIVIPNWDRFQHYKDRAPAWIKLHLSFLGNDAWLELSTADRCLLICIWMLIGRYGNGRLKADERWLKSQAKAHKSSLTRLNDAGFIQFSASPVAEMPARAEVEGSKEPKKESAASGARRNGAARRRQKELAVATAQATEWMAEDAPHLVHRTVRETWPDLADSIIAGLPRAETTPNGSDLEKPAAQEPLSAPRADDPDPGHAEITDDDIPF
jgi:hypothetical protein